MTDSVDEMMQEQESLGNIDATADQSDERIKIEHKLRRFLQITDEQ